MRKIVQFIYDLDEKKLWFIGFVLELIVFLPYMILGEKSVFPWHDQLDENMLNFILTARHTGEHLSVFPEMMCGVNASALQPFAILFLPLYSIFSSFVAFTIQYAIIFAMAFFGMYACVKEITGSSILALAMSGCFSMLPFFPVYGAAVAGVPVCLYGIICLAKKKNTLLAIGCLSLFATTAHLVFSGYAVLGFWALWILYSIVKNVVEYKKNAGATESLNGTDGLHNNQTLASEKRGMLGWIGKCLPLFEILGFLYLCIVYVVVNYQLFAELLFQTESFISHRSEFVSASTDFFAAFLGVFENSSQHADSLHDYMILPIVLLLGLGVLRFEKLDEKSRRMLKWSCILFAAIVFVAVFYAFCKCPLFVDWKNQNDGILRYFQIERFYWLYPAMWYLEMALTAAIWWRRESNGKLRFSLITLCLGIMLIPTVLLIASKSNFYMVTYEMLFGHQYTGYIPWEDYYAEDVMADIEAAIYEKTGEEPSDYRVAHLGLNPTPALVHGFYTVDGYSNNYPLEYKHAFRKVVEKEFEKSPDVADYYDHWGNRCYLFNSQSGTSFINSKSCGIAYDGLEIDWETLREQFDCEFIFSCGPIYDYEAQGLEEIGYFTSEHCFWGFFVYQILD